jgi:hypothetical protein
MLHGTSTCLRNICCHLHALVVLSVSERLYLRQNAYQRIQCWCDKPCIVACCPCVRVRCRCWNLALRSVFVPYFEQSMIDSVRFASSFTMPLEHRHNLLLVFGFSAFGRGCCFWIWHCVVGVLASCFYPQDYPTGCHDLG